MAVINIRQFSGISPKTPPRYLQDAQAQTAINCPTWLGSLQSIRDTSYIQDFSKTGAIESIYRFGQDVDSETDYWFHWASDVDVVRGFINGDTSERTFYTGDGVPKVTDNTLALTGTTTKYPLASYNLGIPQPTVALTAAAQGTPDEGASKETRVYTYTIVNQWDEESAPFTGVDAGSTVDVSTGQTVKLTLPAPPTGNYNPQTRRIYRSTSGVFLFVAEIPIGDGTFIDDLDGDELNEELPSLTWLPPADTLAGLVGLPNGILAGFTGIDVYFSEPYRPFAWPIQYNQSVGYSIVGLGNIDTTLVVLTTGRPYFIQGSHPDAMVVVEADVAQACMSKDSIVSMGGMVFYASPDGLVGLSPGGSKVLTESLFDKYLWSQFKPESIRAYQYENRYVAFYDNGTTQGGFIYDPMTASFTMHDMYATGGYSDLKNDSLYLVVDNKLHKWEAGTPLTYTWRSKKFTLPDVVSFTCFRLNAETYPVDITIYRDGEVHHTATVTDREIRRLPVGYGHDWEVEVTGTGEIFNIQLGQSPRELASG